MCSALAASAAGAPQLPVPCIATACGAQAQSWLKTGNASFTQQGNQLDVTQRSNSVELNWQSFNISAEGKVDFIQPSASSVALNRIFQNDPSQIFGALNSNGKVYLLNQNGFIFGSTAVVNVGGLLASSLNINPDAVKNGIASQTSQPALQPYTDAQGKALPSGAISVESGASLTSDQGQVLLFAPDITNEGAIQTPNGQTILGAGQRVFLAVSNEPSVRGLLIQVGSGGTVTNGTTGTILADEGNVTLAALAVNQNGRVSATTTVRNNGSIILQAQDTSQLVGSGGSSNPSPDRSGTLILGPSSVTEVTLEGGPSDTTVDVNTQPKSFVDLEAGNIELLDQASIIAPSGNVVLNALGNPQLSITSQQIQPDDSRIYLAPSSTIDVSGADITLPASRNSLTVQLRGSELEDSPQQRDGALHGLTVSVDLRAHGTRSDGTTWIGTPIADLSGDIATIQRDVFERNLTGGTIELNSTGSVIESPGATLNVSGGEINWLAGYVQSSILLGADGKAYPIASADPSRTYVGTLDSLTQSDPHWGTSVTYALAGRDPRGTYQPAYVEGKDAGSVSIIAPGVVLDGAVAGGTTVGPLQRLPTVAGPLPAGQLYRSFDQVPLGGALILGNASALPPFSGAASPPGEVLESVSFAPGEVLPTLTGPTGGAFDPQVDPLPAGFVSSLRPDLLGGSGITRLSVYAQNTITVPQGTTLSPGAGGSLTLAAGQVHVAGTIDAPDGSVTLEAVPTLEVGQGFQGSGSPANSALPALILSPGASIEAAGEWINDNPLISGGLTPPLYTSGGQVQLASVGGSLVLPNSVTIDVSGGAQRTAAGSLVAGAGGSVKITANPSFNGGAPSLSLEVDPSLAGFGLRDGGALSLTLPSVCLSATTCASGVRVDPSLLTDFGFENVSLSTDAGSLEVAADINTTVRQRNLAFLPGAFDTPSAGSLAGLTSLVTLPDDLRRPENLQLSSATGGPTQNPAQVSYADLTVDDGAVLSFDPLAKVSLTSNSRIFQNGVLRDPGGSVTLTLTPGLLADSAAAILDNQGIWLGPHSIIDVSGVAQLTPNNLGLSLGSVLPGGSIAVSATRGYLLDLPGSTLEAAGTSAVLDLHAPGSAAYSPQKVGSAGGSISLFAAEGMQLDGALAAPAGAGSDAPGGSLSLTLNGNDPRASLPLPPQYDGPRVLTVAASSAPTVIGEGSPVPVFLNGDARIPAATITAGGFDEVSLSAHNLLVDTGFVANVFAAQGSVVLESGVSLSPRVSLVIDAPQIAAQGSGTVSLSSAYVALGSTDTVSQQINTAAVRGGAVLEVQGDLIDLVGALDLNGFGAATLSSSGDIRAVGVQAPLVSPNFLGQLSTPGNLTLAAQQIYPTTLTSFSVNLTGPDRSQATLSLLTSPGTPSTVLSAAGSLTLQAQDIEDAGVVRAPMGTVSLVADTVTLSPGSVVSVSTGGATIPFGKTQGGTDWIYDLETNSQGVVTQTSVYGTASGDLLPPQKQVSIVGTNLEFEKGATIDVSGGGDLLAYEFTPGLGGTRDVLASPGTYAVLPGVTLPYAPLDPHEDIGFNLPVGSAVYLSGGGGLPAGTYALLPARYALLPGAFLVTPVSGYTNLAPGQTVSRLDGSVIVSGYRTYAGTGLSDSQTSGFDIAPGSYALQEAQYTTTSANSFFAAQASAANTPAPRLPADAGALAISAAATATLQGTLAGSAAAGARGSTVDVTSANLIVSSDPSHANGAVLLDPTQLNQLGAESILLGGTRTNTAAGTNLDVNAASVTIDSGVSLTAPEILLAATSSLTLDSGSSIRAAGTTLAAEPDLQAVAGAALLRVSTGPQTSLQSPVTSGTPPPADTANVTVASGAVVSAPGSLSIDAGGTVDFAGSLSATNAAVRLGGSRIALGTAPAGFSGIVVSPSLFAGLADSDLTLKVNAASAGADPGDSVQVFGPVDLTLAKLTVDAPGIVAEQVDSTFTASIAGSLTLTNSNSQTFTAAPGTGSISMSAAQVLFGGGPFTLSGVQSTSLTATQELTALGSGTVSTAGGLSLKSPVFQTGAGKSLAFVSGGDLVTSLNGSTPGAATANGGPGGVLSFTSTAGSVTLGGHILLPGGSLDASAPGSVQVATQSLLDVSGFSETFDGEVQSAPGGTIQLSSASGSISVNAGATLDVSSGTGRGGGGTLGLTAPGGSVALAGQVRGAGGSLIVDAQNFGPAGSTALLATAEAAGFSDQVSIHERGPDDLIVARGTTLAADDVNLTADQGNVRVFGTIDAANGLGGTIVLAASGDIEVGGSLLAGSPSRSDRGGTVELLTTESATSVGCGICLDAGSIISVGGASSAATGTVWLRAPQQVVLDVLGGVAGAPQLTLNGTITGAGNIYVEGYRLSSYTQLPATGTPAPLSLALADVTGSPSDPTSWYALTQSFMNEAPAVVAALAHGSAAPISVLPGLELDTPGDLHLSSDWDLSGLRINGAAGVLTVRAGGSFFADHSISDGFMGLDPNGFGFYLTPGFGPSWSYRLAAGADLTSANPLAVLAPSALAARIAAGGPAGDLVVAPGSPSNATVGTVGPTVIRTGTGSIDIATAGDLTLGNQASVIYSAGAFGPGLTVFDNNSGFQDMPYPQGGGNVTISVGRNLNGAVSNQLFNDWLWRTAAPIDATERNGVVAVAWTPSFGFFEQGIGALGGGDLTIRAGGNITDLGASVPSIGVPVATSTGVATEELNDGVLRVTAGGDIAGGKFLDLAGQAFVRAGGAITEGSSQVDATGQTTRGLYPVLAVGSGQFDVLGRDGVSISAIVDPTLLPQSTLQSVGSSLTSESGHQTFFSTYADSSAVTVRSVSGDATLVNDTTAGNNNPLIASSVNLLGFTTLGVDTVLSALPPSVAVATLGGNTEANGSFTLWPAAHGNLDLLAQGSVLLTDPAIRLSDADPTALPSVANPVVGDTSSISSALTAILSASFPPNTPGQHAVQPVHGGAYAADGQPDLVPARIVGLTGDVTVQNRPGNTGILILAKPVDVVAGQDIVDLSLTVQQFSDANVSNIVAGRDVIYPETRGANGALLQNAAAIEVDGPGRLAVQAGRDVNLGTSGGITSVGNLFNPALPAGGADLSVTAGVSGAPQYQAFIDTYLTHSDVYDNQLLLFADQASGSTGLDKAQALAVLEALPLAQQAPLIEQVLFDELRAGGRIAAAAGATHGDFTRAFTALTTLFPGSNPNLASGETDPYHGDILLYFSRVYTLQGGNINLIAPGGQVNVGLATPPADFGVTKTPSQLGVVAAQTGSVNVLAYSDVQVNQSRVFAADGGDILMWSTEGNIDAGRGAKTAISAPPPIITVDSSGKVTENFSSALIGSGIQALATTSGVVPGDVDLFAPHGVVNANEAGIVAGNLTIAATAVLGANNISVSGTSVGLPPVAPALGAVTSTASAAGTAASGVAEAGAGESGAGQKAPQAAEALSWLDVFVIGLGEEQCRPDDTECMKRQKHP